MAVHQIDVEKTDLDGVDIEWYDQFRTPLTPKMIEISLKNYKSWMNTGFFIEITFAVRGPLTQDAEKEVNIFESFSQTYYTNSILIFQSNFQSLSNFLKSNGGDYIFDEHARLNHLQVKTRRHFVNILYKYIVENNSVPTEQDIIVACNAAIQIFPSLNTVPSSIGGIVSTQNPIVYRNMH